MSGLHFGIMIAALAVLVLVMAVSEAVRDKKEAVRCNEATMRLRLLLKRGRSNRLIRVLDEDAEAIEYAIKALEEGMG